MPRRTSMPTTDEMRVVRRLATERFGAAPSRCDAMRQGDVVRIVVLGAAGSIDVASDDTNTTLGVVRMFFAPRAAAPRSRSGKSAGPG